MQDKLFQYYVSHDKHVRKQIFFSCLAIKVNFNSLKSYKITLRHTYFINI